jgi:hypothetical protein
MYGVSTDQPRNEGTTVRRFRRTTVTPVVPAFLYVAFPQTADGYNLEAGSSSLHMIAAALVGASFAFPVLQRIIKAFFDSRFQKDKTIKRG